MEFHRLCRNPASEIAVSIAFHFVQISLAILSLDAAQPIPCGALGLDTNEVTTELPGASSRERSWEAAAEFHRLRPQPADHSLLQDAARVLMTQCRDIIAHTSVFFFFLSSYLQL